jgi:hypothetical protein
MFRLYSANCDDGDVSGLDYRLEKRESLFRGTGVGAGSVDRAHNEPVRDACRRLGFFYRMDTEADLELGGDPADIGGGQGAPAQLDCVCVGCDGDVDASIYDEAGTAVMACGDDAFGEG